MGAPFVASTLETLARLGCTRIFVLANRSSTAAAQPLIAALEDKLAAPLCSSIGMNGGEAGLIDACNSARSCRSDCVVTIGGGAVQDAGKLIRLWLSADDAGEGASVEAILAASKREPMPALPPQVACPNSFAMAELTGIAGITTAKNEKTAADHPAMMPTCVIFDPALADTLPDWVRFGTALRGVEHAVGTITLMITVTRAVITIVLATVVRVVINV